MLRAATLEIANTSRAVTVVGRSPERLRSLTDADPRICVHQVDYRDAVAFDCVLKEAVARRGPADLALCWIHDDEYPGPALQLAAITGGPKHPGHFVHVLGSAAGAPTNNAHAIAQPFCVVPHLTYQQVILGFLVEGAGSRWLSHAEICAGVLRVMDQREHMHIVGTIRPWSARP